MTRGFLGFSDSLEDRKFSSNCRGISILRVSVCEVLVSPLGLPVLSFLSCSGVQLRMSSLQLVLKRIWFFLEEEALIFWDSSSLDDLRKCLPRFISIRACVLFSPFLISFSGETFQSGDGESRSQVFSC